MKKSNTSYRNFFNCFNDTGINSFTKYENDILKNLYYLTNTVSHVSEKDVPEEFSYVKKSVLVYGMESYIGKAPKEFYDSFRKDIKEIIRKYEPRIVDDSVDVKFIEEKNGLIKLKLVGKIRSFEDKCVVDVMFDINTGQLNLTRE